MKKQKVKTTDELYAEMKAEIKKENDNVQLVRDFVYEWKCAIVFSNSEKFDFYLSQIEMNIWDALQTLWGPDCKIEVDRNLMKIKLSSSDGRELIL